MTALHVDESPDTAPTMLGQQQDQDDPRLYLRMRLRKEIDIGTGVFGLQSNLAGEFSGAHQMDACRQVRESLVLQVAQDGR
jgi:hypothetical protein